MLDTTTTQARCRVIVALVAAECKCSPSEITGWGTIGKAQDAQFIAVHLLVTVCKASHADAGDAAGWGHDGAGLIMVKTNARIIADRLQAQYERCLIAIASQMAAMD